MRLFFAGAEVPSHRKVLTEVQAPSVALSYMGLRRRVKFSRPWLLNEKFPQGVEILVDSGAYTVNREAERYTQRELKEIAVAYEEFIVQNIDRLDAFTEFDALALGRPWIEEQRERFKELIGPSAFVSKFIPIWHPEWGVNYLQEMAEKHSRIGVMTTDLSGRNLTPILNKLADDNLLHGVAMTQMDAMQEVYWDSVSSTSWISPQQYGDTIVWTGRELKRYPKKQKEQARKRYRTLFLREGFDPEEIECDNHKELLRLSIWSWLKFVDHINRGGHFTAQGVTKLPDEDVPAFAEDQEQRVDTQGPEVRNNVPTAEVVKHREQTAMLPVLGVTKTTVKNEDGEDEETSEIRVRSESGLQCNTCFLAAKCPAYEPGSNCAYNIPVSVQTKPQMIQLQNGLVEMQAQRVMFMRFAEQQEGGYADPNLSVEMDRLQKMIKAKHEMEQSGFSLRIEAKGNGGEFGQPGFLARTFGQKFADKAAELPAPVPVEEAAGEILDVEWTEG